MSARTWRWGVACLAGAASAVSAQRVPLSQHGTVSQRVAFTDIEVTYNRPVARGRTLFGPDGIVKWGVLWHPGADSASFLRVSRDVTVEGAPLKAGEYSLWTIPAEHEPWTVIFSRNAHVFHTRYPGESNDALRVHVPSERGAHMEALTWYFPVVGPDSAVLRLHWGETVVPLRIRVSPTP